MNEEKHPHLLLFACLLIVGLFVYLFFNIQNFDGLPRSGEFCKYFPNSFVNRYCREAGSPENMQATLDARQKEREEYDLSLQTTATAKAPARIIDDAGSISDLKFQCKPTILQVPDI